MISNTDTKVSYIGDGKTVTFPFTFGYDQPEDIKVTIYDTVTAKEKDLTRDFFLDETARTITYPGYAPGQEPPEKEQPAVLTSRYRLVIHRVTPIVQLTDLGDKYPLPTIEKMPDKLTMICQEFKENLSRCVMAAIGSGETAEHLLDRINHSLIWEGDEFDALGKRLANVAAPIHGTDAVNKDYLYAKALTLDDGDKYWDGENRQVKNIQDPEDTQDAVTKNYLYAKALTLDDSDGLWNGEKRRIKNVDDPIDLQDAVNKNYFNAFDAQVMDEMERTRKLAESAQAAAAKPWQKGTRYKKGDIVYADDGDTYRALQDSYTIDPVGHPEYWKQIGSYLGHDFFEIDVHGGLMPTVHPVYSDDWELDKQGSIMPRAAAF